MANALQTTCDKLWSVLTDGISVASGGSALSAFVGCISVLRGAARHVAVDERHGSISRIVAPSRALKGLLELADTAHLAEKIRTPTRPGRGLGIPTHEPGEEGVAAVL